VTHLAHVHSNDGLVVMMRWPHRTHICQSPPPRSIIALKLLPSTQYGHRMAAVGLLLCMYVVVVARGPLQSHSEEVAFFVDRFSVFISLATAEWHWIVTQNARCKC
jgi:hypothetical protein